MTLLDTFDSLEEGDLILYNDKKTPLQVTEIGEERVFVEGPKGGEYVLFEAPDDPDTLLVAKPGNRKYASYVNDLRTVGRWEEIDDDHWQHSRTGAELRLEKNSAGFWTIAVENFEEDVDIPRYGYTERSIAEDELQKILHDNPEG